MNDAPLLTMHGIVKRFPGVLALGGVELEVRAGEVHCLLGQNGAGKSTLIKVLSASYQPDEGEILWEGEPVALSTPQTAMDLGISTIYQELDLVPDLSVAENIFLGHELSTAGFSQRGETIRRTRELLARLGHSEIPPTRSVGRLSPAAQQIVSMARALSHDTRLLILDEPSAVLDQGEVNNLFRVIRDLTAEGVAVVYISHRLEEIRQIGDRITVLKDGSTVATGLAVDQTPTSELIKLMTGRSIEYVFPPRGEVVEPTGDPVLEVTGLELPGVFTGVDLSVRAGEIVGLAGLVGAGRSEILETLYGARRPSAGHRAGRRSRAASRLRARRGEGRRRARPGGAQEPGAPARPGHLRATSPCPRWGASAGSGCSTAAPSASAPPRSRSPSTSARRGWIASCASCRAATSRRSSSPGGCSAGAACCSWTSRPEGWTSALAPRSTPSSARWPTPASPSWSCRAR